MKSILSQKKGKGSIVMPLIVIVGFVLIGLVVYQMFFKTANVAISGGNTGAGTDSAGGVNVITSAPTVTLSGIDALSTGTTVTITNSKVRINGGSWIQDDASITGISQGQTLDILVENTSLYSSVYIPGYKVPYSAADTKSVPMYKNATLTTTLYNSNGLVMNTGAQNESMSTGSTANLEVKFTGEDQAATGDMVCVVDIGNKSKVSKVLLDGVQGVAGAPNWYTAQDSSAGTYSFQVANLIGSSPRKVPLQIYSVTGQDLSSSTFKLTCYAKTYFLDTTTGTIMYDISDSLGATKAKKGLHTAVTAYLE